MAIWTFVRLSLRETSRNRLLPIALALTALFIALLAWGSYKIHEGFQNAVSEVVTGVGLELMAFFMVSFVLTLLAVFFSGHSVHQEADSGLLQAVLTKPVRRFDYVAGRWIASALLLTIWTAVFAVGIMLAVGLNIGYYPPHPVLAGALLLLEALVILSVRLFFGAFLGTLASGIVPLFLIGLADMGGLVEQVGRAVDLPSLVTGGVVTSLVVPTDALWRGASFYLLPDLSAIAGQAGRGNPFVSLTPVAGPMVLWAIVYAATLFLIGARIFSRRDI